MEATILEFAKYLFQGYRFLMVAYILMSWIPSLRESKVGYIIEKLVEPYLSIFRKVLPPFGGIDFSPIIAFFVYSFLVNYALSGIQFILGLIF